ncbi:MAG: tetratricopeptide repeat protein [Pyrinomonadaceae bacterium]
MSYRLPTTVSPRSSAVCFTAILILVLSFTHAIAQSEDVFGDTAADPVKLFERGQNAHARGDLLKAVEFYDEAIKVRPEFAEAEFQRANAFVALSRSSDAEAGFRHAIALKQNWSLPYSALGALLVRLNRDSDAESVLRQSVNLDARDNVALRILADIRLRAGDAKEALKFARLATDDKDSPLATWLLRALAERATGDTAAASASLEYVLKNDPSNVFALLERAEIQLASGNNEIAIRDLQAAEKLIKGDKGGLSRIAIGYERAGKPDEGRRVAGSAGLVKPDPAVKGVIQVEGTPAEIEAANSEDPLIARNALEVLLKKNPTNPMLLARLGASYRTIDPTRSLALYYQATKLEPNNSDYATGYSSALVQARRFADAVAVLRRVIAVVPNNYAAHANLATALYELKQYPQALDEYEWLLKTKPDLTVAHYFIATAHDYLGEYEPALQAYESFLARADQKTNQLEIEKVKLRLPSLRRQIQLGQGIKRKPERRTQ